MGIRIAPAPRFARTPYPIAIIMYATQHPHRFTSLSTRRSLAVFVSLVVTLLCFAAETAQAGTYTWVGSGTDNNWSTAANWGGGAAPGTNSPSYTMLFVSGTRLSPNLTTTYNVLGMTFGPGASAFTIGGATLSLWSGGILNSSYNTQTITSALSLGASQTFLAAAGNIVINDAGITMGAITLTIDGSNNTTITTNGGGIAGTGGLIKNGTGTLLISGSYANSYGATTVNNGKLEMNNSVRTMAGSLTVGDGIGNPGTAIVQSDRSGQLSGAPQVTMNSDGLLNTNGYSETISSLQMTGGSITTSSGTLVFSGSAGAIATLANANTATIAGNVDLGGFNRAVTVASGGGTLDLDVSANLFDGAITLAGPGILRLSGSNTLTAGIAIVNSGTLAIANDYALGSGTLTIPSTATLRNDNTDRTLANAVVMNNSTLTIGGSNNLNFTGPISLAGSNSISLVGSTGTTTFAGAIPDNNGPVALQLQSSGSAAIRLSGLNSYSGGTHIVSGIVSLGNDSALGYAQVQIDSATLQADSTQRFISNAFLVNNSLTIGGTLPFTVSGNIDLVQGFVTVNNTALTTFAGPLTDFGLLKTGSGTLVLSGAVANNYLAGTGVGLTEVSQGMLQLAKTIGGGAVPNDLLVDNTGKVQLLLDNQLSGTSSATVQNSGVLDLNGHSNSILNLTVSGSGAVTTGSGTLTVNSLAMTGGSVTTGSGGSLVLQGALTTNANATAATIGGALNLAGMTQALSVPAGSGTIDLDIPATVSNGGIIMNGPGTLRLSGSNTFAGGLTLVNGVLAIGNNAAIGTGALVLQGGTMQCSTVPQTISNPIQLTGSACVGGTVNITIAGNLTGTGMLNKVGAGTLNLPAGTGLSAQLILSSGSLYAPGISVNPGGVLTQNGGSFSASYINSGAVALTGGTYTGTLTNLGSFSYGGGVFNGYLDNEGTAVFNASGTVPTGLINNGVLTSGSLVTLTVHGSGLDNEGTLIVAGGGLSGSGAIVNNCMLAASGTIAGSGGFTNNWTLTQGNGSLTLANTGGNSNSGSIVLNPSFQFRLLTGVNLVNTGFIYLNGGILTGGTLTNLGTVVAPGRVANAFTNNGVIQTGSTGAFSGGAIVNNNLIQGGGSISNAITNNGIIQGNAGQLTLSGSVTNNSTIQGLFSITGGVNNFGTIDPTGGAAVISGVFQNQAGGLVRVVTGNKLTLNTGLAVNAGVISLVGGVFDNNGHSMDNTGSISGFGVLSTGGLTNDGNITFSGGVTSINGSVTNPAGHAIQVIDNAAIFSGNVINSGTFKIVGATASFTQTFTNYGVLLSDSTAQTFTNLILSPGSSLTGGAAVASLNMTGASINSGAGVLTLNGNLVANSSTAAAVIGGALDLGGTNRTVNVASGGNAVDLTVSAGISDGSLTKTGAGTLLLSGSLGISTFTAGAGVTDIESPLSNATITSGSGSVVNIDASGSNSTVNVSGTTCFSVSQSLAALNLNAGGVIVITARTGATPIKVLNVSSLSFPGGSALKSSVAGALDNVQNPEAIPEPSVWSLVAGGLGMLATRRRRSNGRDGTPCRPSQSSIGNERK